MRSPTCAAGSRKSSTSDPSEHADMTTQAAPGASRDASAPTAQQWVYLAEDAPAADRDLLGGKGAGLAAMTQAGLPVPAAFTITTAACNAYQDAGGQFPPQLWEQTLEALQQIEQKSGRTLGDAEQPTSGVGAIGRQVLDAGHDGHRPQPGVERRDRRRPGAADEQRALRVGCVPTLRPDVRAHRARRFGREARPCLRRGQARRRRRTGH